MGRCSLGASNTSVTMDIKSGYSIPDCSVPDLCSASNIRLMFPDSRSHRAVQIAVQISVQIGLVRLDAPHISVEVQQGLGGTLHFGGILVAARPPVHHAAGRRMHHVHPEIRGDFLDHFWGDCACLPRVALNQGVLAQRIDQARDPARVAVYFENSVVGKKYSRIRAARQLQAAVNVTLGLVDIERRQVGAESNTLLELPQIDRIQLLVEFGLPDQQYLQQLLLRRFQIGQQPDFLEHFHRKMVSFVHHQHRGQALLMPRNYERTQIQQKVTLGLARSRQSKITGNILQEIGRRQPRIEDIRIGHVAPAQQLQQAEHQQGLARAYFPGHYHEAFASPHSVVQSRQRLVVSLRREKKRRVGSNLERVALQIVKTLIHWEKKARETNQLSAKKADRRPRQYGNKHHRRRRPSQPHFQGGALLVGNIHDRGNFGYYLRRQQLLEFLLVVHPVVHKLKRSRYRCSERQPNAKSDTTEFEAIGKVRPLRKTRRINYLEALAPLLHNHARSHGGVVLFFQQIVVVRFGLVVTTRHVGQFIFADRFLILAPLILVHFHFERSDRTFMIRNLDLVRLQLTLDRSQQGNLRRIRSPGAGCRITAVGLSLGRTLGMRGRVLRLHAGHQLIPHLLSLRDLFLQVPHIRMAVGVVRTEVGQLRFELVQFLVESRQADRRSSIRRLG